MRDTAVLFVHGIQGSPGQFRFLEERLPGDTHVRDLLLPGHGGDVRAFRASGRSEWTEAVERAAEEMRGECGRVIFVGHSMGCLLGLRAERDMPGTFSGMLMICCPFSLRPTPRYAKNGLLSAFPGIKTRDPFALAQRDANGVMAKSPLEYLTCAHPYLELLRLIRDVKRDCPRPACGVRWSFSERDEIVGPASARFAGERIGGEIWTLPGCGHDYFTEQGRETLARALLDMLQDQ